MLFRSQATEAELSDDIQKRGGFDKELADHMAKKIKQNRETAKKLPRHRRPTAPKKKVNERKFTDAEKKEMRAKAEELKTKYNKLEELALDIDHDIEAVRIQMKKAESDKEKAAFKSKITALTNKKKGVINASNKAWDDFEDIKLELGKKYNR